MSRRRKYIPDVHQLIVTDETIKSVVCELKRISPEQRRSIDEAIRRIWEENTILIDNPETINWNKLEWWQPKSLLAERVIIGKITVANQSFQQEEEALRDCFEQFKATRDIKYYHLAQNIINQRRGRLMNLLSRLKRYAKLLRKQIFLTGKGYNYTYIRNLIRAQFKTLDDNSDPTDEVNIAEFKNLELVYFKIKTVLSWTNIKRNYTLNLSMQY